MKLKPKPDQPAESVRPDLRGLDVAQRTAAVRGAVLGQAETRAGTLARAIDAESRTIELAFSSETPVERWYGREILDHSPGACRMDRLRGGPLMAQDTVYGWGHEDGRQVGAILDARIDADRIGRATCKLSRSDRGEEILQDLVDEIRGRCSVGYLVHAMQLQSSDDTGDTYLVTDWEPIEVTLVPVPADTSVGVGRALSANSTEPRMDPEEETVSVPGSRETDTQNPAQASEPASATRAGTAALNPDAAAIRSVGEHFGLSQLAEDQIMLGTNLADFRALVRQQRPSPVPTAPRIEMHIPRAGQLRAFRPELYSGGRREAEEQAYRAGQWCLAVIFGRSEALRWCRDYGVAFAVPGPGGIGARTLTGLTPGQQVVVPDELVLPIIDLREQFGIARRFCDVHPMTAETASVPRQASGTTAYFVGREAAPTATDPNLDNVNLVAKNIAAETRISNDYADDSAINLADWVAREHARSFAVKEDNCLFNGDGTSSYGGIVGLRVAILSKAGAVDAASGHDTFSEFDAADLRLVMAKLPDIPGIMPSWFTSKAGQNMLFGRLTDAAGGNTKRELSAKMPDQWAGYDIVTSPAMPKVTTDLSDVAAALFGDLRMAVKFGDRRGMTMLVDPYSLSSYQQTKIIHSERIDIVCHGVGDASEPGPVVALIGE